MAVAENKDITLSPRFFNDDKFLLQSEFDKKIKNLIIYESQPIYFVRKRL